MNSALFHAARPGDIGGRGRGGGSRDGVREAAALAQQMGFGGQDFGPQVDIIDRSLVVKCERFCLSRAGRSL